jgi:hypothetical protein
VRPSCRARVSERTARDWADRGALVPPRHARRHAGGGGGGNYTWHGGAPASCGRHVGPVYRRVWRVIGPTARPLCLLAMHGGGTTCGGGVGNYTRHGGAPASCGRHVGPVYRRGRRVIGPTARLLCLHAMHGGTPAGVVGVITHGAEERPHRAAVMSGPSIGVQGAWMGRPRDSCASTPCTAAPRGWWG